MNLAQSTYAPSPKIKVKDYIIPLEKASEQESKPITTSSSFHRKKSKKIPKSSDPDESERDS